MRVIESMCVTEHIVLMWLSGVVMRWNETSYKLVNLSGLSRNINLFLPNQFQPRPSFLNQVLVVENVLYDGVVPVWKYWIKFWFFTLKTKFLGFILWRLRESVDRPVNMTPNIARVAVARGCRTQGSPSALSCWTRAELQYRFLA